ncbi:MAG TPA: NADH dehydrogenase subunit, partial [Planctomycetaceae bacterium]|nr:NADH dehydrogenase subunit [Planctomycetaceae bacterium]
MLGRVIPPGGLPLHVGAVVINVETALNVSKAAERPVTEKYLTVGGAVAEPVTLRVPVGITLGECLEAAGGPTVPEPSLLVGGVMMGYLADGPDELVDKRTGGVIVLDASDKLVERRRQSWQQIGRIGRSACDQCSFCTELCPRWLLGHPIEPHKAMRSLGFNLIGEPNVLGTAFCCECNLCSLYSCPEELDPKNVCVENKRRLAAQGRRWQEPPFLPLRAELLLPNRRAPTSKLMYKLGLHKFRNVGPLRQQTLSTRRVGIKLKQHVGVPCEPAVSAGQRVEPGQVLGRPPVENGKPALGATVHASIGGTVTAIENGVVWIEQGGS